MDVVAIAFVAAATATAAVAIGGGDTVFFIAFPSSKITEHCSLYKL